MGTGCRNNQHGSKDYEGADPGVHQGGAVAHGAAGTAEPCQKASHGHKVPGTLWWEEPFLSKQYWYLQSEKIQLGVCKLRAVLERLEKDEATSSSGV